MMIAGKIKTGAIDKTKMFVGTKGTYLDIVLMENKGGTDQFGNDFMIVQSVSKEDRAKGIKGAILGNARYIGEGRPEHASAEQKPAAKRKSPIDPADVPESDDVPF